MSITFLTCVTVIVVFDAKGFTLVWEKQSTFYAEFCVKCVKILRCQVQWMGSERKI